jgi:hypothetical protein
MLPQSDILTHEAVLPFVVKKLPLFPVIDGINPAAVVADAAADVAELAAAVALDAAAVADDADAVALVAELEAEVADDVALVAALLADTAALDAELLALVAYVPAVSVKDATLTQVPVDVSDSVIEPISRAKPEPT